MQDQASKQPLDESQMQRLVMACFAAGLFVHVCGNNIILMPPFVAEEALLADACSKLRKVIERAQRWVKSN